MKPFKRIILIVLDSLGVGEMPDADDFGDRGSDTLGHIALRRQLHIPNLQRLGIGNIRPLSGIPPANPPHGNFGKMAIASRGKDTTTGHWEMMGLILENPFPTYPRGFPPDVIDRFESAIGRKTLGNCPASGTQIIDELGEQHLTTGFPIIYTSADSVFQIAAHEEIIPVVELYEICETARRILSGDHEVGRVIARPFVGSPGGFQRTARRKDYAIPPHRPTVLDHLNGYDIPVTGVGKIASIYCYRGVRRELKTRDNDDTAQKTIQAMGDQESGLIFSNFVDFDMVYGHRNNADGYARALEEFDQHLEKILDLLAEDDLLMLVSDHGCDPTTASTDHSREYTLLLVYGPGLSGNKDLGVRGTLADVGATVAENFGVASPAGKSFLGEVRG